MFAFAPEATEPRLLFRVHQVDCLHGELGEAVRPPDSPTKCAGVAHVDTLTPSPTRQRCWHCSPPVVEE